MRLNLRTFFEQEKGNIAILFGLSLLPLTMAVGAAIDYGRIAVVHSRLQHATDAAALATASAASTNKTMTDAQAMTLAQNYVSGNAPLATATVTAATVSSDRLTVCINSQVQIPTTIMKVARINTMTATATACANVPGSVDNFEIALVLDNSGSMSESAGGTSKIKAVKTAATNFVATLFSKAPSRVSFSVAPFTSAVVAVDPRSFSRTTWWADPSGQSPLHWNVFGGSSTSAFKNRFDIYAKLKAVRSSWDWGGCFESQPYPLNVNDTAPSSADASTLLVPMLAPDEPDSGGYPNKYVKDGSPSSSSTCKPPSDDWSSLNNICKYENITKNGSGDPNAACPDYTTQTLLQLTSTQTSVNSAISAMSANGTTNLHEGFIWGWRSISPNASIFFPNGKQPSAYNAANNRKIIVFMTDGSNHWSDETKTVTGSDYEGPGYYSLNGSKNLRLPDGSRGDGVNYQTALAAAANSKTSFFSTARKALDELTLESCNNAKALGVEVYTIGFSTPSSPIDGQGLNLLQSCATDATHYYPAANVSDLNNAFEQIAAGLGKLHLSQ